ncbi:hypothetical protein ONE63_011596 [Megalurothrips usitatus]|uniref:Platelet-derived growth factor (PDGF) family profile domain-containing protein n=1 Tax=Megalurothrips usitatus TaxID=439358 RepID=A0AAV7X1Z1_9NEOP|nr:hypothetical protein ONE63_011596 [Megalurothrips usitatus]
MCGERTTALLLVPLAVLLGSSRAAADSYGTPEWTHSQIYQLEKERKLTEVEINWLNEAKTLDDIFKKFPSPHHQRQVVLLAGKAGAKGTAFRFATCKSRVKTLCLERPEDLNLMYWPSCIEIEQCDGCCSVDYRDSCQPVKVENVTVKVGLFIRANMSLVSQVEVPVQRHTACKCHCRVKVQDCSPLHTYNPSKCLCQCNVPEDELACSKSNQKQWDNNVCSCDCKNKNQICSSGLKFWHDTCSCEYDPQRVPQDYVYSDTSKHGSNHHSGRHAEGHHIGHRGGHNPTSPTRRPTG